MRIGRFIGVAVSFVAMLAGVAFADTYVENADDADRGDADPFTCSPHPLIGDADDPAPAGSLLCDGFVLSEPDGDPLALPTEDFHAALDVSLAVPPGAGPFPLVLKMHGYGGDKGGTGDDPRMLEAGLAHLRYSTRGFGASYGDNQLMDEDFEIRDIQNIVRQVVEGSAFAAAPAFSFDRKRIAIMGTSYGGAHSLLLAQAARRAWPCAPDTCEVVTALPHATWTDLIYSLVPNGRPSVPTTDADFVVGIEKFTYVAGFFATGHRQDARYAGNSYPPFFPAYFAAINAGEPYQDPVTHALVAPTIAEALTTLTIDRSAAYQEYCDPAPIPILYQQGWTDDLFTAHEVVRFRDVMDAQCGSEYPLKVYFGNEGHARARDGADGERDFRFSALIMPWLRYHLLDEGPAPAMDVTVGVTEPPGVDFDPGKVFTVPEIEDMEVGTIDLELTGLFQVAYDPTIPSIQDLQADPIVGGYGGTYDPGVAALHEAVVQTTGPLQTDSIVYTLAVDDILSGEPFRTICGIGSARITGQVGGSDVQYAVRVWDIDPAGPSRYLVDRGVYRFLAAPGDLDVTVPLHGDAWRLVPGHSIEVEVTNADMPYLRPNNLPSTTSVSATRVVLPTCEEGTVAATAPGRSLPAPLAPSGGAKVDREALPAAVPPDALPRSGGDARRTVPLALAFVALGVVMIDTARRRRAG